MHVKIYKSIAEVDEKKWNSIVGKNRIICTHKYLEAVEKSKINDCQYYYPVFYEGNEIIAHTSVYFIRTELDTFAQGALKKIINLIRHKWKGFLILKSLECGTPVALGTTISFRDGVNQAELLTLMCQEIENLAKEINVRALLFRDFYDEELELYDNLTKLGYTRVHNLPSSKIKIIWNSFDEYLNSMRGHYKYKIKKNMRKSFRDNIMIEVLQDFSGYADELERLWTNVYDNAKEYKRERLTSDFFINMDEYLGDRSSIILIKKDNIPVGFALLLFDDTRLNFLFSGLDYLYNKEYSIYFNLLYKIVEVGINKSMKEIDMGITTIIPKVNLGAKVVNLNMYMKNLNPVLNKIFPKLYEIITPKYTLGRKRVFTTECENNKSEILFNKSLS